MYVYFARSIRGDRRAADAVIYKGIVQAVKDAGHHAQFELPVNIAKECLDTSAYIYQRDLFWLDKCQAMVAEITNVSHGVGYEIAYAKHVRKIPIMCVAQKDSGPFSAMLVGDLKVCEYRDLGDLSAYIQSFLEEVNGN